MPLITPNLQPKCATITLFPHMPFFRHQLCKVRLTVSSFLYSSSSVSTSSPHKAVFFNSKAKKVSKQDCDHTCRGLMVSWLVWGRRGGLVTLAAVTLGSSCMVARPDVLVEDCAVGAVVCVLLAVSVAKVIDL